VSTEMNLIYENFVRQAFGIARGTNDVDRWGDPASLANTDVFDVDYIEKVKAAISYSMAIINNYILEEQGSNLTDASMTAMDDYIKQVINAGNKARIYNLIVDYKNDFDKYLK